MTDEPETAASGATGTADPEYNCLADLESQDPLKASAEVKVAESTMSSMTVRDTQPCHDNKADQGGGGRKYNESDEVRSHGLSTKASVNVGPGQVQGVPWVKMCPQRKLYDSM